MLGRCERRGSQATATAAGTSPASSRSVLLLVAGVSAMHTSVLPAASVETPTRSHRVDPSGLNPPMAGQRVTEERAEAGPAVGPEREPARTDTTIGSTLPESLAYRVKRILLGAPLVSEHLGGQRLGKPTALAVLSSDVMSSSAYATEQILRILVPVAGLAAFALVTPITALILAVLAVVTICYRDVVRAYPKAGGSYVVSRDNFGPIVAQIAGAALLISYTITVAVSVAAGA